MSNKKTVYVIYYSTYGHVQRLAKEVVKGVEQSGVNVKLFQIAETLPQEVLDKIHAPPKDPNVPVIQPAQLAEADGFLFGIPSKYGYMPAQIKAFFDACGQLWMTGALIGKFAGIFFSTGNLGGGQETTAYFTIPFLAHMGMAFVPLGNKDPKIGTISEVHGGTSWGSGTLTGPDGSRQPTPLELDIAILQGLEFGKLISRLKPAASSDSSAAKTPSIETKKEAAAPTKKDELPKNKPDTASSAPPASAPSASAKPKARTCHLL